MVGSGGFGDCAVLNSNPDGTVESSSAAFTDPTSPTGLSVGEGLFLMQPSNVAGAMASYAQLPTTCAAFSAVISGLTFAFTAAPLTVSEHGDQTTATRLTATTTYSGQVITIYLDLVFILDGDTIVSVIVSTVNAPDINATENASADAYTVYAQAAAKW